MEIVILVDGSGQRLDVAFSGTFKLGRGIHFFLDALAREATLGDR